MFCTYPPFLRSSAPSSPYDQAGQRSDQQQHQRTRFGHRRDAGRRQGRGRQRRAPRTDGTPPAKTPMLSPPTPPPKSKITEAPSPITRLLAGDKALSAAATSVPANTLVSPL